MEHMNEEAKEYRRYWVNLGQWESEPWGVLDEETALREAKVRARIKALANHQGTNGGFNFITDVEDEAKAVAEQARAIAEDDGFESDGIDYRAQPQCSQCGRLLRFSMTECPNFGEGPE